MAETTTERKPPSYWAAKGEPYDCTGLIGPLFQSKEKCEWPMYSFDRPASIFWNAVAGGLNKRGWTDEQIKTWLQSKNPRWALDGDLSEKIEALGEEFAKTIDL